MAADPDTGWDRGDVEMDIHQTVVRVTGTVVRTWPIRSVRREAGDDDGIVLSVAGDRVYFRPDDAAAFDADAGAVAFNDLPPMPTAAPATRQAYSPVVGQKNAGVAAVLSFFFSGLGQIYNGELGKGMVFIGVQFVNFLLTFILIGFLTGAITWVWGIVDAYKSAERINAQLGIGPGPGV